MSAGRKKIEKEAEVVVSKKVVKNAEKNPDVTDNHTPAVNIGNRIVNIVPCILAGGFVGGYGATRNFNVRAYNDKVPSNRDPKADKEQKRRETWDFFADWIVYGPALNVPLYLGGTFIWGPIAGGVKGWDAEHKNPLRAMAAVAEEMVSVELDDEPTNTQSMSKSVYSKSVISRSRSKAPSMVDEVDEFSDLGNDDPLTENDDKKDDETQDKSHIEKQSSFSEKRVKGFGMFESPDNRTSQEIPANDITPSAMPGL